MIVASSRSILEADLRIRCTTRSNCANMHGREANNIFLNQGYEIIHIFLTKLGVLVKKLIVSFVINVGSHCTMLCREVS